MNNCLITKLKGTVDNTDLMKLDEMRFKRVAIVDTATPRFNIAVTESQTMTNLTTGGTITINPSSEPQQVDIASFASIGDYISIPKKSMLRMIESNCCNVVGGLSAFLGCTRLTHILFPCTNIVNEADKIYGDVYNLRNMSDFERVILSNSKVHGDLGKLLSNRIIGIYISFSETDITLNFDTTHFTFKKSTQGFLITRTNSTGSIDNVDWPTNITSIYISENPGITGNITSFGKCINLNQLATANTGITGSIEDFVAAQIANGRESVVSYGISNAGWTQCCTFGGVKYPQSRQILFWDSASKITIYSGLDSSYNIDTANRVYAKGATAEEIAAWQAAGKAVTVIN